MGRSQETFNKKAVRNKKEKKRKDKEAKKLARKEHKRSGDSEAMIAYVDEFGNISDTPPDPTQKREVINAEDIIIGIPPKDSYEQEDPVKTGTVTYFNDDKGFGFIKDALRGESIFVHITRAYEGIREGDKVQFETEMGDKGPVAIKVVMV
ncbi:MAG: cold-shock protein [Bacteroidia bacterium]